MASTLTLTLNYSAIKQAVKADTYITGQIDKSADMVKNAALAFNEQAGDEDYHEDKIFRTVKGALAKFEAALAEYVETSNASAEIKDSLNSSSDTTFTITATINSRTSNAFEKPMAYLAQEFVINTALYYWWQPIKPALAKDYLGFAVDNLADVRRCLAKSAPDSDGVSYNDISGSVTALFTNTYRKQTNEVEGETVSYFLIPMTNLVYGGEVRDNININIPRFTGSVTIMFCNELSDTSVFQSTLNVPCTIGSNVSTAILANSNYQYMLVTGTIPSTSNIIVVTYTE